MIKEKVIHNRKFIEVAHFLNEWDLREALKRILLELSQPPKNLNFKMEEAKYLNGAGKLTVSQFFSFKFQNKLV